MAVHKMPTKIEINADMGEGLGRWKIGPDEEIMPHIDVANIAAGFHASDPTTLHRTVRLAKQHGVAIGAHPGFPDLAGFGRRRMELSEEEVFDLITYQVGAVQGFCQVEGVPLNHVKPHGALYFYILQSASHCRAAVQAIKAFNVPFYGLPGTVHEQVAKELGVPFVPELFVDIEYSIEGNLIPPAKSKSISPEECADRVRKVAMDDHIYAQNTDKEVKMGFRTDQSAKAPKPFSVCLHSDMPGAAKNVIATRKMVDSLNAQLYA